MESISFANALLLLGSALVVAGILSSLIAFRFGGPLLLVFLAIGMLAGEDGPGRIRFEDYALTYLLGSGALAIILFDGGLRTRLAELRGMLAPALMLATVGVLITAGLAGIAAVYLLDLGWLEGLLLGAIIASTDAAAVFFLLRTGGLQLRKRVGLTLEVESGTNDPVAVFLTIALVELLLAGGTSPTWSVLASLAQQAAFGTAVGVAGGYAASLLLNKVQLPSGLHPLFVAASAILIFAAAAVIEGSGFLAAYLAGLVLGNRPIRAYATITAFHDALTWLCQIVMFIMLGLLVTPSRVLPYVLPGLAIAFALMLVARPVAVWLCLAPFKFSTRHKAFVSWVGLRGAVSIFLSAVPVLAGLPNGALYFNVAFVVVLVSLLVQGWTIVPAARRLGAALPRAAEKVHRVELDLPGQLTYEMVGFPVFPDSAVLRRGPLPRWARPILVVRAEVILQPAEAGPLQAGDYAYFLAPPDRASRLDQLFGHRTDDDEPIANAFPLAGDTPLARLTAEYGFAFPDDETDLTVAGLFARRFEDRLQSGDRLALDDDDRAVLVVVAMDDDRVTRAALLVEEDEAGAVAAAVARPPWWRRWRLWRRA